MKHFRGEKRFYYGMSVLVLVFIIAGLTSNLEGGVRGNRQEKEAFDQKPEEVQTEQENQEEETQVVSNPNIRVLLMTDGYKNTIHPSVTVSSTTGLSITYGEKVEECEAGTEVTFMPDDSRFQSGNIRIQAKEGEITVNSLKRGYGSPSYQGILELRTTAEGIAIINELPVENYLCRVVPSEMPSGYEIEALKAQAVCARSYAYRQMAEYGYAFQFNMTEDDLTELMMSMSGTQSASYDNNLQQLGYADFSQPSSISIYPKDFDNKEKVVEVLDHYNQKMEDEGKEEQVISHTDIVGTMMSSVTTIINTISYVLIAFVAISLLVSSIMIGVITYISVLERKKEIGILRAIGASKGNISQVFNAETFIIGLCAGLIGIGLTLLILIPGNMLIHALADNNRVSAILPIAPAIVLILLSVVLTLLGGLIPSRKAAKSDPVTALRTE